jgi:hypothetical protein
MTRIKQVHIFVLWYQVDPVPLQQVPFDQRAPDQPELKHRKKQLKDFHPAAPCKRTFSNERYAALVHDLSLCQPDVPFLTIARRGTTDSLPASTTQTLPSMIDENSSDLLPASIVTVSTSKAEPKSVLEVVAGFVNESLNSTDKSPSEDDILNTLVLPTDSQHHIEQLTVGQHANPRWHRYRNGVVTGTLVHSVCTRMETIKKGRASDADRLINQCMGNGRTFKGNTSTRYGLANEPVAVKKYIELNLEKHSNFCVDSCGLVLDCQHCFIGASPDRIAYCGCHEPRIVEIKCPATMAKKPCGSFDQLPFVDSSSGTLQLNKKHQYFSQVVLYMAVCKKEHTDFVIWSPQETCIITVDFDPKVWHDMLMNILYFYKRFMVHALLQSFKKNIAMTLKSN